MIIRAKVRIGGVRDGALFVPFHYGYWNLDAADPRRKHRAANELTVTAWDPASNQPLFKISVANVKPAAREDSPRRKA